MIWFPFIFNFSIGKYDYVYVDEYQDLNKAQLIMAKNALNKDTGRLIIFGDKYQSLYSWRMADSSVIDSLRNEGLALELKLPISYRCPKEVIKLAKQYIPDISCLNSADTGTVNYIGSNELINKVMPGSFILSRTNAPLIGLCLKFIKLGKKSNILGKDIGNNLAYLVKKSKKTSVKDFLKWLDLWKEAQLFRLKEQNKSADIILDKYDCLLALSEDSNTCKEILNKITVLFDDNDKKNVINCGTIHGAKGKETDNVFILNWTLRHSIIDGIESNFNEENNIYYVAITRAKQNLYFVNKY